MVPNINGFVNRLLKNLDHATYFLNIPRIMVQFKELGLVWHYETWGQTQQGQHMCP